MSSTATEVKLHKKAFATIKELEIKQNAEEKYRNELLKVVKNEFLSILSLNNIFFDKSASQHHSYWNKEYKSFLKDVNKYNVDDLKGLRQELHDWISDIYYNFFDAHVIVYIFHLFRLFNANNQRLTNVLSQETYPTPLRFSKNDASRMKSITQGEGASLYLDTNDVPCRGRSPCRPCSKRNEIGFCNKMSGSP